MATLVLTIPDAQVPRVVDAMCTAGGWTADLGVSRVEFARQEAARILRERVLETERRLMMAQAGVSAAALTEPPVT